MKTDRKLVENEPPMKTIRVDLDATITLHWEGGEIELSVPEDADEKEIEKELMSYLKGQEAEVHWYWADPEIDDYEVIIDDEDADQPGA